MLSSLVRELRLMFRILAFAAKPEELDELGWRSLAFGLPSVWLVGYGRWWDEPRDISWPHRFGLGSVAYVLILSALLWLIGAGMARRRWSYPKVLAFVCFTALPAMLYAIPVEMFTTARRAVDWNIAFLLLVSVYRVALLLWFYFRGAGLPAAQAWVTGLLPLGLISFGLAVFGMAEGIIEIMGGIRESGRAAEAFAAVTFISCTTIYTTPILLIVYFVMLTNTTLERRRAAPLSAETADPGT